MFIRCCRPCSSFALLVTLLCISAITGFQSIVPQNGLLTKQSLLRSVTPKSPIDSRSDLLSSTLRCLLLPAACLAATTTSAKSALAADGEFDPLVQGILDFTGDALLPTAGDDFLVQVYDASVNDSPVLLAGAKLPYNASVRLPFRFQLFKENLLLPEKKWVEMGEFDQLVVVTLCRGAIEKGGICTGKCLAKGEGVSKVVTIGTAETEIRKVRLFAFIKMKVF